MAETTALLDEADAHDRGLLRSSAAPVRGDDSRVWTILSRGERLLASVELEARVMGGGRGETEEVEVELGETAIEGPDEEDEGPPSFRCSGGPSSPPTLRVRVERSF